MSDLDRRTLLRRGGMAAAAAGTAWVTPVITARPALAGPSCALTASFAWSSLGGDGTQVPVDPTPFASYAASGAYPALTIEQSFAAVGTPAAGQNPQTGFTKTAQFGGFNSCYRQSMTCDATDEGFDTTFTFSSPVWNLVFNLYDIDDNVANGGYIDEVFITSAASFTFDLPTGGTVTGNGTSGDRWTGNGPVDNDETDGNVEVTFPGPVSSFTVSFRSGNSSNTTQAVGIGDFTFCR